MPERKQLQKMFAIDATITLAYLGACLLVFSRGLPEGVNRVFSAALTGEVLAAAAVAFLLLCLWLSVTQSKLARSDFKTKRFTVSDLTLVLLPMTPVIQYVIANQNMLTIEDSLMSIGIFVSLTLLIAVLFPLLLGRLSAGRSLMFVGLSLSFVLFNMGLLSAHYEWRNEGDLPVQAGLLVLVFAVCAILYRVKKTILYAGIITYFLTNSTMVFFATQAKAADTGISGFDQAIGKPIRKTPDIFLLTYDSYVPNQTMLQYGIDNSAQERYLQDQDFTLYDGTYSLGSTSISSMGQMLGGVELRSAAGGRGDVQRVLAHHGYETYGIFQTDFFFRKGGTGYDYSIPRQGKSYLSLALAILEGRFRFNVDFNEQPYTQFVNYKRRVLGEAGGQPKFVHSHTGPWHSQNSGMCLDDEVAQFEERLDFANLEMQADVQTVISANPGAIIIVNGDHGPYLTKNCYVLDEENFTQDEIDRLDIQDRFGTFLAIRWPQDMAPKHDEIAILQDVFPVAFADLFEDDTLLSIKLEPSIEPQHRGTVAGVNVVDGIIIGGANNGERLFDGDEAIDARVLSDRGADPRP